MDRFTQNLRRARKAAGLTQQQLADSMGVMQNAVSNWEHEVSLPRARQLPLLAQLLRCQIDDLFQEYNTTEKEC